MTPPFQKITSSCGSFLLIALATGLAVAAEPSSMPMMSKAEVKELINKSTTAEDHHRLAAYYNQKAEMMEAEAVEHDDLAKEYATNPATDATKHPMSGKSAAHCKYFAQAARKAAVEDRALAAAHEDMASKVKK